MKSPQNTENASQAVEKLKTAKTGTSVTKIASAKGVGANGDELPGRIMARFKYLEMTPLNYRELHAPFIMVSLLG